MVSRRGWRGISKCMWDKNKSPLTFVRAPKLHFLYLTTRWNWLHTKIPFVTSQIEYKYKCTKYWTVICLTRIKKYYKKTYKHDFATFSAESSVKKVITVCWCTGLFRKNTVFVSTCVTLFSELCSYVIEGMTACTTSEDAAYLTLSPVSNLLQHWCK